MSSKKEKLKQKQQEKKAKEEIMNGVTVKKAEKNPTIKEGEKVPG